MSRMQKLRDQKTKSVVSLKEFNINVALYTKIKAKTIAEAKTEIEKAITTFGLRNEKIIVESHDIQDEETGEMLTQGNEEINESANI